MTMNEYNWQWQWVDNAFGPMGWFTDAQKNKHQGEADFSNGHWRRLDTGEVFEFKASIKRLAYEQS